MKQKPLLIIVVLVAVCIGLAVYFAVSSNKEANNSHGELSSGIKGTALLGPSCPIEQLDQSDPGCGDRPYQARLVVTSSDGSQAVKEFSSDQNGIFSVAVPPGEYTIQSALANTKPRCLSGVITVTENKVAEATVRCDTGLR